MRLAAIGDTHLGRSVYGYDLTPKIRRTMYSFFRFCVERRVDHAVHLGDLFDTPRPPLALEKLVIQWCNEFERVGINLHILVGNHDAVSKGGVNSALGPLKAIDYKNVQVHERPVRLCTASKGVDLLFVPFPSPALYESHSAWLSDVQAARSKVKLPSQAIVLSHLNIEGATMGEQDWVYRGGDYCIPPDLPGHPTAALTVSGHIHKQQWAADRHLVLGSAQRLSFGEMSNRCSFLLAEDPEGEDGCSLFDVDSLRMVNWDADASAWGNGGIAPTSKELVEGAPDVCGALVKVQPMADEQTGIDWRALEAVLYEQGAEHVTMMSPLFVKRKVKQQRRSAAVGEPTKAAAFFIKSRIKDQPERRATMRVFKRLQEEVDGE